MINNSEHQPSFIEHLRWLADGAITDAAEAVQSYHAALESQRIKPYRSLEDDLVSTLRQSAYGGKNDNKIGTDRPIISQSTQETELTPQGDPKDDAETPDFSKMTQQQKLEWNRRRLDRTLGT